MAVPTSLLSGLSLVEGREGKALPAQYSVGVGGAVMKLKVPWGHTEAAPTPAWRDWNRLPEQGLESQI